jgi:gluconate 2-dehydrogenase gamma chain
MTGITRRDWLLAAGCWAEVLRAQGPSQKLSYFDRAMADEVEAIAETILPADSTPGAREAGVIWFIDGALAGYDADRRETYHKGLAELQRRRAALFPGSATISGLTEEQRTTLLKSIEETEFFRLVRLHTIVGFFGHPKYGGNRNDAGRKLIGIEASMHFHPPFGYYDREANQ